MSSTVLVEVRNRIGFVTLNRPEQRNAITPEMLVTLDSVWQSWSDDADVRVVVLTGMGDASFCAGADLRVLMPLLTGARGASDAYDKQVLSDPELRDRATLRCFYPKPVITVANGTCIAGGMEMFLAGDIRFAADHAKFSMPEAQLGLIPANGGIARLTRELPWSRAMGVLIGGRVVNSDEALDMGLVNATLPSADLQAAAADMAQRIANSGPLAVQAIKRAAWNAIGAAQGDAFAFEDEQWHRIAGTRDAREGAQAFVERRKPEFTGD